LASITSGSPQKSEHEIVQQSQALLEKAKQAAHVSNYSDAIGYCAQALVLTPNHVDTLYLMAVLKRNTGYFDEAEKLLEKLRVNESERVNVFFESGMVRLGLNRPNDAIPFFHRAVQLNPQHFDSQFQLAFSYLMVGQLGAALTHLTHARNINVKNIRVYQELGNVLSKLGRNEESNRNFQTAYSLNPKNVTTLLLWAEAEEFGNNIEHASFLINSAISLGSDNNAAKIVRGVIERRKGDYDSALASFHEVDLQKVAGPARSYYFSQLGMLLDRMGRYEEAMQAFDSFNKYQREELGLVYAEEKNKKLFQDLTEYFKRDRVDKLPRAQAANADEEQPIFIVGFPRSGTTMAEQIITSHKNIAAGDELHIIMFQLMDIHRLFPRDHAYPQCLDYLANESGLRDVMKMRQDFLSRERMAGLLEPGVNRFTDKTPLNEVHMGMIHLMFPEAPIIHLIRHPLDVVMSSYFNDVRHGDLFSTSLETTARHYGRAMDIVEQYKRELDLNYMSVRYEDIVEDIETNARKIIDFINEPWDPACLEFYKNKRRARTASYAQVTEKVYTRSVHRYKNYQKWLEPIIPVLEPYIERYGYTV